MNREKSPLRNFAETAFLAVLMYLVLNLFSTRVRVDGSSMEPTVDHGSLIFAEKLSFIGRPPERGELVVHQAPIFFQKNLLINRIVGLPGDSLKISKGLVWVNGEQLSEAYVVVKPSYEYSITLADDQYFMLGDNRNESLDSHIYGPIPRNYLVGRPMFAYWPLNRIGRVDTQRPIFKQEKIPGQEIVACLANCEWINQPKIQRGEIRALLPSPAFSLDKTLFAISYSSKLFLSSDGAKNWSAVLPDFSISKVIFSPNFEMDQTIVIGSFDGGIFISSDKGAHWTQQKIDANNPVINSIALRSIAGAEYEIYAAAPAGVFRSTDHGNNWNLITGNLTPSTDESITFLSVVVAGQDLFVVTNLGLFASKDQGKTWEALKAAKATFPAIYVSPAYETDRTVFAIELGSIYKITDLGKKWVSLPWGLPNSYWLSNILLQSQLAFSPNFKNDGVMYLASPSGVYRSDNVGQTWKQLSEVSAYSIAVLPVTTSDGEMFLGDHTGVQVSRDGGVTWNPVSSGFTSVVLQTLAFSPNLRNDGLMFAGGKGVWRSTDSGEAWVKSGLDTSNINEMAVSPDFQTDGTIFAGADDGLKLSIDRGVTWETVSLGFGFDKVLSLAISPEFKTDRFVLAGIYKNGLLRSVDGGHQWDPLRGGMPQHATIYEIAISPVFAADRLLFVATNQGLYRSSDGGETWTSSLSENIPDKNFLTVQISPDFGADQTVYAAGDGIWKSEDGGQSWTKLVFGECCYTVTALRLEKQENNTTVYAGTFGGGVFRSKDGGSTWEKLKFSNVSDLLVNSISSAVRPGMEPIIGSDNWGLWIPITPQ